MAMFERLFVKRKLDYVNQSHETSIRDRSSQITLEQVRLLLFKECDWRGRKLLFDSSTIEKVVTRKDDKPNFKQTDNTPYIVEVAEGFSYVYKGPAADASALGEMIFGAVAMNYKGVSLKIHIMDKPRRLMCTKVFCVPTSRRISRVDRKSNDIGSGSELRHTSKPLNVPTLKEEGVSLSFSMDRGDSGFYGDQSPYSSLGSTHDYFSMFEVWDGNGSPDDIFFHSPPGRKLSTSSNGSWQRRTFQNVSTRFDISHQNSNLLSVPSAASNVTSTDSQVYSNSTTSGTCDSLASVGSNLVPRKSKLGLALLITVTDSAEIDLLKRCVEHSPQLQALVCRLRLATLSAGAGGFFVSTLYRAATDAAKWLSDLMYGPRVQPMWLTLVSEPRTATKMADSLLADLCAVLAIGDTKHTNFFISTLLTHVLMLHLGWVTTVSPYDTLDPQKLTPVDNDEAQSKRPYNALWAQLSDLCGCIGFPPRAARTIISGSTNLQFINRLLIVLTYFIRSGDVRKSEFSYIDNVINETKVITVNPPQSLGLNESKTVERLKDSCVKDSLKVPSLNTHSSDSSVSSQAASDVTIKRSRTLINLSQKLSTNSSLTQENFSTSLKPVTSQLKRTPTMMGSLRVSSDSSLNSSASEETEAEQNVIFVLGDNEKLVGLKNKSSDGKSVKKSSKVQEESVNVSVAEERKESEVIPEEIVVPNLIPEENAKEKSRVPDSPSKCCGQTLQHSKPIKHSGYKFEFDKYPQIVTNYMKSKNLEILDRHYIGKPGNLKLNNFQFDPTVVPPIQEEKCEICYKCQQMTSMLQTPSNASEMEYMNDIPRQAEPQYAKELIVEETESKREMSPKTFVRKTEENTIVVNISSSKENVVKKEIPIPIIKPEKRIERSKQFEKTVNVKQVIEFPMPSVGAKSKSERSGFDTSLLGGVTDHYVPDLIIQGTLAKPCLWENELRRDLELSSLLNKRLESPTQSVAIIGDTNTWEVRVLGRECAASGMSSLVGAMLDALPAMRKAKVPANQCLYFLESKLREFCVLSKTLADILMTTDFCDIATLTKSLNIDVNDVPLLLAVATTHTPQVATRYGISYR